MSATGIRADVRPYVCEYLGGTAGTITADGAVGGTDCVLPELVAETNDDTAHDGDLLVFPDADSDADRSRIVTAWTAASGAAAFAARAQVKTGERYELYPAGMTTYARVNAAIDEALQRGRRSVQVALPAVDRRRVYPLSLELWWLRSRNDVDGVYRRRSPCLLPNEEFDLWDQGASKPPTGWQVSDATKLTVARSTLNVQRKGYSALLTQVGGGGEQRFFRAVTTLDGQLRGQLANGVHAGGLFAVAMSEVVSASAATWRVYVDDGVSVGYSGYHPGDGGRTRLIVAQAIDAAATKLDVGIAAADTAGATAYVDRVVANESAGTASTSQLDPTLDEYGSVGYPREWLKGVERDMGGQVAAEVGRDELSRRMQLVVVSRMPYLQGTAKLADDNAANDASTYLTAKAVASGAVYFLSRRVPRGVDMSKWDELRAIHGNAWLAAVAATIERPVEEPVEPLEVRSA